MTTDKSTYKLDSIRVSGGFLDGMSFDFSENMNCIIGARGAGKTSLVELVRFCLRCEPSKIVDPVARKRFDDIIDGSLGQGHVELSVTSAGGAKYIISRANGSAPIVYDTNRQPTGQRLGSSVFSADIFSQNEVETIAGRPESQLALLESFDRARLAALSADITDARRKLDANYQKTCSILSEIDSLEMKCARRAQVEKALAEYKKAGSGVSEDMDNANELRSQREAEKRQAAALSRVFAELERRVKEFGGSLASRAVTAWQEERARDTQNSAILEEMRSSLRRCLLLFEGKLEEIQEGLAEGHADYAQAEQQLSLAHDAQDAEYMQLAEQAQADRAIVERRMAAERELNDILEHVSELEDRRRELAEVRSGREELRRALEEALESQFAARLAIANRINNELGPEIKVEIHQYGNLDKYMALIVSRLHQVNASVQYNQVADKVAKAIDPATLISIVRSRNMAALTDAGLNENQAKAVVDAFATADAVAALEVVDLPDRPTILLKDKDTYKPTDILSTGQKCNAILPILLMDSDRPLVIDQPEDNLDNGLIHSLIVKSILKVKRHRQLLFVTHNPNIPVLGEAERMLVFTSDGTHGSIAQCGTVDECKEHIVNLLEGGAEAFRRRSQCYELK